MITPATEPQSGSLSNSLPKSRSRFATRQWAFLMASLIELFPHLPQNVKQNMPALFWD
jgi:hypothetical protein